MKRGSGASVGCAFRHPPSYDPSNRSLRPRSVQPGRGWPAHRITSRCRTRCMVKAHLPVASVVARSAQPVRPQDSGQAPQKRTHIVGTFLSDLPSTTQELSVRGGDRVQFSRVAFSCLTQETLPSLPATPAPFLPHLPTAVRSGGAADSPRLHYMPRVPLEQVLPVH